jgi:ubiquinone/menaquinone biosynthesis C-methylase UbiE
MSGTAETEQKVAAHYGKPGLEETLLRGLADAGLDPDRLRTEDLAPVDEFHMGWRPATVEFVRAAGFPAGAHLLDVGSGIGGPARYFAENANVRVTGIDLTPEYVDLANSLSRRTGLADRTSFRQASALAMPFADAAFDGAFTIHVAMNIADKPGLYAETRRVLKPGAIFATYDIMRGPAPGDLPYPLPWSPSAETSFVVTPAECRALHEKAGFAIVSERDRTGFVQDVIAKMRAATDKDGPPPLSRHILTGPDWKERAANIAAALQAGLLAPYEIIARAV